MNTQIAQTNGRLRWEMLSPDFFKMDYAALEHAPKTSTAVEEILDVYYEKASEDGSTIFIRVSSIDRKTAHKEWHLHAGAQTWIYNSKWEVLLQKRSLKKDSSPGLWDISAAGHLETWDTMISWALREIREELWISVNPEKLGLIAGFRNEVKKILNGKMSHNNEIIAIFLLKYDGEILDLSFDPDEVEEFKFIPLEELESDWSDEERLKHYTSKGESYRKTILENLRKVCR